MTPLDDVLIEAAWLRNDALQELFDLLVRDGGQAMVAGGAVRNALLGIAVSDVDVCTTLVPETVVERLELAGHKAVPTGIGHGTVTAFVGDSVFEVTTLREDIETDGRHAVVRFGTDWLADAQRRDLTINGLYCDRQGQVYDLVDGYRDILSKTVRFIGDPGERIREDALRILRFFRFFGWYGGGRPDAAGLKACAAHRALLSGLSVERVWSELRKLLSAHDPGRALLWMRTAGILSEIMPESEKWGIDAIPGLIELDHEPGFEPDALQRVMAMTRPDPEAVNRFADRLKLSGAERERLSDWAVSKPPSPTSSEGDLVKTLYRGSRSGILDAMKLEVVHLRNRDQADHANRMLKLIEKTHVWERPEFPVQGRDLLASGLKAGPELGRELERMENLWVESGFALSKADLLKTLS